MLLGPRCIALGGSELGGFAFRSLLGELSLLLGLFGFGLRLLRHFGGGFGFFCKFIGCLLRLLGHLLGLLGLFAGLLGVFAGLGGLVLGGLIARFS